MMEYYRIVVDTWRFFKWFGPKAENTEKFFGAVLAATSKIADRYPEHKEFATSILLAFVEELRRIGEAK